MDKGQLEFSILLEDDEDHAKYKTIQSFISRIASSQKYSHSDSHNDILFIINSEIDVR